MITGQRYVFEKFRLVEHMWVKRVKLFLTIKCLGQIWLNFVFNHFRDREDHFVSLHVQKILLVGHFFITTGPGQAIYF